MANITRRSSYADPWRDFFDLDFLGNRGSNQQRPQLPAVNIGEDDQGYHVEVVAPGFKKEAFKIHMDDDLLTISAEQKQENAEGGEGKQYSRREYSYSSFTRSLQLTRKRAGRSHQRQVRGRHTKDHHSQGGRKAKGGQANQR